MAEVNIYYNEQTNSWWINKEMDGFSLRNHIKEYPIGLGTVEYDIDDKSLIKELLMKNLYEVSSIFIPEHLKMLNGITEEIEENGFENAVKVTNEELKGILEQNSKFEVIKE